MIAMKTIAVAALATAAGLGAVNAVEKNVTIVARDYAFEVPDTLQAGRTRITLKNLGTELHHVQMMRLEEGKTLKDVFAALQAGGPPPAWAKEVGGPNTPVPGGESRTSLVLRPGRYGIICFIPSPDGKPHVMKGMAHEFTVVPTLVTRAAHVKGAPAAKPVVTGAPDVTLTLSDYAFGVSTPLTRGHHVVRVRNSAAQSHEVFVARLAPGKTTADALAWIEKQAGAPPILPLGGTVSLATGAWNDVPLDLEPGEYAFFCFVPDAKDGKPHFMHGMVQTITLK